MAVNLVLVSIAAVLGVWAGSEVLAPDSTASAPASAPASPVSGFPRNANGQTYGSALGVTSDENQPDLILVEADSGVEGYVRKKDLHSVDGGQFLSPSEAARHAAEAEQKPGRGAEDSVLRVYASDGTTVIGTWRLGD